MRMNYASAMGSEFAKLLDLAVQKGEKASDVLTEIQTALINLYLSTHSGSHTIQVSIDSMSGTVRIYQNNIEISDPVFQKNAESMAREIILNKLDQSQHRQQTAQIPQALQPQDMQVPQPQQPTQLHMNISMNPKHFFDSVKGKLKSNSSISSRLFKLFFWTYHIIILIVVYLVLFSFGSSEFRDNLNGLFGGTFSAKNILVVCTVLIPLLSLLYVVRKKIVSDIEALAHFFFTLEVPLITISLISYMLGISTIPQFSVVAGLAMLPVLFYFKKDQLSDEPDTIAMTTIKNFSFVAVSYIAIIYSFYTPTIFGSLLSSIAQLLSILTIPSYGYDINGGYKAAVFIFYGLLIFVAFVTALIPYILFIITGKKFAKIDAQIENISQLLPLGLSIGIFVLLVFGTTSLVSENHMYERLNTFSKSSDYEERAAIAREVIEKKEEYMKVIYNHDNSRFYLTPPTYFYQTSVQSFAQLVKPMFNFIAKPFVEPIMGFEVQNALNQILPPQYALYAEPLQTPSQVEIDTRKISISLDEKAPLARVTFDESYSNNNFRDEEVRYEFELPEDAVISDLKLGPDLEYQGIIAPRGAAETTFNRQVVQQRDPALLEQIGPHTFRLRVYPIPSRGSSLLRGKNQRVSLTYSVGLSGRGVALPKIMPTTTLSMSNPRLVQFEFNGNSVTNDSKNPYYFSNGTISQKATMFCNGGSSQGNIHALSTIGVQCSGEAHTFTTQGKKIAIMLDVTTSNKHTAYDALKNQLRENPSFLERNTVDLYLYEESMSKPINLKTSTLDKLGDITYFGFANNGFMSTGFQRHVSEITEKGYDAIISFQEKNYFKNLVQSQMQSNSIPLIVVDGRHMTFGGNDYSAYLHSNMYLVDNLDNAFIYATLLHDKKPMNGALLSDTFYMDNGSYDFTKSQVPSPTPSLTLTPVPTINYDDLRFDIELQDLRYEPQTITQIQNETPEYLKSRTPIGSVEALTASLLIDGYLKYDMGRYPSFTVLDNVHAIAQKNGVVSPYSSYLALVNEQQLIMLYDEIQKQSRYDSSVGQQVIRTMPSRPDLEMGGSMMESTEGMPDIFNLPSRSMYNSKMMDGVGGGGSDISVSSGDLSFRAPTLDQMALTFFVVLNVSIVGIVLIVYALRLRKKPAQDFNTSQQI